MKNDINFLIDIMEKFSKMKSSELDEQDTAAAGGATDSLGGAAGSGGAAAGGSKNNVNTWSKIVGSKLVRSKNRLGNEKWESGVGRGGPGNQIGLTKWRDIVQPKRDGPANQLT